MSLALQITTTGQAPRVVTAIARAVQTERITPIVGRSAVNTIRTHLFGVNNSRPNALGGRRTNFYATAARGTSFAVVPDGVVVSISNVGIRQRILGGTITPKPGKKFLTIPATAEAYGKRASEFDDLVVVFGAGGRPIGLAHALFRRTRAPVKALPARLRVGVTKQIGQHGGMVFWFAQSVTQKGDPTVLPYPEQIYSQARKDVAAFVQRAADRAAGSTTGGPS